MITQLISLNEQQTIKPLMIEDESVYNQMSIETQEFTLRQLLGDKLYNQMIDNLSETRFEKLLNGDEWQINNITYKHKGIKFILAYFIYAEWIIKSQLIESYTGVVIQKSDYSEKANEGYIKNLSNKAKEIAMDEFERVKLYLLSTNNYPEFSAKDNIRKIYFETIRRY